MRTACNRVYHTETFGSNHMELDLGTFSYMDSNSACNCSVACDFGYPFNQKLQEKEEI